MRKGDIVKIYSDPIKGEGALGRAELLKFISPAKGEVENGTLEIWEVRFLEGGDVAGVVLLNKSKKGERLKAGKGDDEERPPEPPDDIVNPWFPSPELKPANPPEAGLKPPKPPRDDIPPQPPLETEAKKETTKSKSKAKTKK